MTPYQQFIHQSRYARYRDDLGRRETWEETVTRYLDYFEEDLDRRHEYKLSPTLRSELYEAIHSLEVMPSMRALMTAGPALQRENVAGFNCSYVAIDNVLAFAELLYVLMCGTGVGFSVERQFVSQMPEVPTGFTEPDSEIVVPDSKQGWAEAFSKLLHLLYCGIIPKVNYSLVRPAGMRLMTFGGRASGPEPLRELFEFVVRTFRNAKGRKLNSLECHEICCKIGEIVVVGGVRRSALISLSNLSDQRMRDAKSGNWWMEKPYLALSNNSVAYTEKPEVGSFMDEWTSLYRSHSGERGIFNRQAAVRKATALGRRDPCHEFGTNPCAEIVLRSGEFCNLSEVVVRPHDGFGDLTDKVRLASILGTFQSTQTTYKFLRPHWAQNSAEERLLGVSLTGIYSNPRMTVPGMELRSNLTALKSAAIYTNVKLAREIGIPRSAAVTTVKPSGTVSQLVDCPSGIHPAHARYYIRRVRADNKDPLTAFMRDAGVPCEPAVNKEDTTSVFSFPVSVEADMFRNELTAIEHLDLIRDYNQCWSEHAVSCTVSVRESEWPAVGGWVFDNFDNVGGLSFLPFFEGDTVYPQMPYETIGQDEYRKLADAMPETIDWSILGHYEGGTDNTSGSQTLACSGGACEIVDIAP